MVIDHGTREQGQTEANTEQTNPLTEMYAIRNGKEGNKIVADAVIETFKYSNRDADAAIAKTRERIQKQQEQLEADLAQLKSDAAKEASRIVTEHNIENYEEMIRVFERIKEYERGQASQGQTVIASFEQAQPYEAKLAEEDRNWNEHIDLFKDLKLKRRSKKKVMAMPLVLLMLNDNFKNKPISIVTRTITKATAGWKKHKERVANGEPQKSHKHEIIPDTLKNLPSNIANPLMVFEEVVDGKNTITIVTSMEDQDKAPIIAKIEMVDEGNEYVIKTIHGRLDAERKKPGYGFFMEAIQSGHLRYIDRTRDETKRLLGIVRFRPDGADRVGYDRELFESRLNDPNIKQKSDLDKQRAQNNFTQYQSAPSGNVRGRTDFYRKQTIIQVFERGDKSTFFHELGHVYMTSLSELAHSPDASTETMRDWQAVAAWLGIEDLDISRRRASLRDEVGDWRRGGGGYRR